MEQLDQLLKNNGGNAVQTSSSFGISAEAKIVGYIEGVWNSDERRIDSIKIGAILSIGGELSYTQQSVALIAVPIPYYWQVKIGLEISTKLGIEWTYDTQQFDINFPEISTELKLSGSLCVGITKIVGGGARLTGTLTVTFNGPKYDFETSVWKFDLDFELIGQIFGFEGAFSPFGNHLVDYQIYPAESNEPKVASSPQLSKDFAANSRLLAKASPGGGAKGTGMLRDDNTTVFSSGGYADADPYAVTLGDGRILAVWIDYDPSRSDINKTALYYSLYNTRTCSWNAPQQVDNDGTADDMPVLKVFNGTAYLVWSNVSSVLPATANLSDVLSNTEISCSVFDGQTFSTPVTVSSGDSSMDICPDITVIDSSPVIVWLKNDSNDLFGQNGVNSILKSELSEGIWTVSAVHSTSNLINSVTAVDNNGDLDVYFSECVDSDPLSVDGYELFLASGNAVIQLTDDSVSDSNVKSAGDSVYRRSGDNVMYENYTAICTGIYTDYCVVALDSDRIGVIYAAKDSDDRSVYYICINDGDGFDAPAKLFESDGYCTGITAYYNSSELFIMTNEYDTSDGSTEILIRKVEKSGSLYVESAFYDYYTLIGGETLKSYVSINNTGLSPLNNYTVYAYYGNTELAEKTYGDDILPGEQKQLQFLLNLPQTVDFDEITFYVAKQYSGIDMQTGFTMPLFTSDLSVENAAIFDRLFTASVMNRGITDIASANIKLLESSEDGAVIDECTLNGLEIGEEEIVSFTIPASYEEGSVFYITAEPLENEQMLANNTDFAALVEFELWKWRLADYLTIIRPLQKTS